MIQSTPLCHCFQTKNIDTLQTISNPITFSPSNQYPAMYAPMENVNYVA